MAKVATQIRLDEELYNDLKRIAEVEKRSLNNLIEYLLTSGVKVYQSKSDD